MTSWLPTMYALEIQRSASVLGRAGTSAPGEGVVTLDFGNLLGSPGSGASAFLKGPKVASELQEHNMLYPMCTGASARVCMMIAFSYLSLSLSISWSISRSLYLYNMGTTDYDIGAGTCWPVRHVEAGQYGFHGRRHVEHCRGSV